MYRVCLVIIIIVGLSNCSSESDNERRKDAFKEAYQAVWDKHSAKILEMAKANDNTSQIRSLFDSLNQSEEELRQKMLDFMEGEQEKMETIKNYFDTLKSKFKDSFFDYNKTMDSLYVVLDVHPITVSQFKSIRERPGHKYMMEVVLPELTAVMKEYNIDPEEFKEFTEMRKRYSQPE